jgi:hypothetical protein
MHMKRLLRVFGYGSIIGRWMQGGKIRRLGQRLECRLHPSGLSVVILALTLEASVASGGIGCEFY